MSEPLLSLQNLSVGRGGLTVLSGVSFDVAGGEAVVLRGPNGSGKTTLLRTVAGLQPAYGGEMSAPSDSVAYAGHADGLKGTLSVTENLSFWAGLYGGGDIAAALEAFELTGLAARRAQALSAGQKRRLGLARLLVTGRPIWVLDEPTVSLDAAAVGLFANAVAAHLAQGGAALMATHIDLGLEAREIDVTAFRAKEQREGAFDEAFL
ncbi:MAG: heme ABC exporter ATP-binding protein CcmA [Pseudomonadota bacterium]